MIFVSQALPRTRAAAEPEGNLLTVIADVPRTGDDADPALWTALLILGVFLAAAAAFRKKRRG